MDVIEIMRKRHQKFTNALHLISAYAADHRFLLDRVEKLERQVGQDHEINEQWRDHTDVLLEQAHVEGRRDDLAQQQERTCTWTWDGGDGYETECGYAFPWGDDTPEHLGFKWCPFCGHTIECED